MVEGESVFCQDLARRIAGVEAIIEVDRNAPEPYRKQDCATAQRDGFSQSPAQFLPDAYLHLLAGRAAGLKKPDVANQGEGEPLVLRYVAPGHDDLLAIDWRANDRLPVFPPVLTRSGWYRGTNDIISDQVQARVNAFLARAIAAQGPISSTP